MSACRSCAAPVKWVTLQPSNKRVPLDAEPVAGGNVELVGEQEARVLTADAVRDARAAETVLYASHFSTCPEAGTWRR